MSSTANLIPMVSEYYHSAEEREGNSGKILAAKMVNSKGK